MGSRGSNSPNKREEHADRDRDGDGDGLIASRGIQRTSGNAGGTLVALTLSSTAFKNAGPIPAAYTCDGQDRSPNLIWDGVPAGAKSLALIVDDPDAPDPKAPKRVWVHWVLYNLPGTMGKMPGAVKADELPTGTL